MVRRVCVAGEDYNRQIGLSAHREGGKEGEREKEVEGGEKEVEGGEERGIRGGRGEEYGREEKGEGSGGINWGMGKEYKEGGDEREKEVREGKVGGR
ncbi:hypothetical protein Pmani_018161 [Petrolisthes manimaculis]|uniref:Uncharacterized protein n=1 Tax=Petrolisthes manimaculis TaxID=1843537 RepID=A0AAE1PN20_9EUCA|nr:hypothetical protein Pmani_018161 [Petrolisthes manimaculis]